MKNPSKNFVFALAIIITLFSYTQGVVVPNVASKYQQAAVAKSLDGSEKTNTQSSTNSLSSYYKKPCKVTPFSKCGTIIIRKSASPAQYTDFSFTSNVFGSQNFFLDDDGSLPNPSSLPNQEIISVNNGTYYINESPMISGFTLYVSCSDPFGNDTYTNATGAVITISDHETVNCSFRNIGSPKPCVSSHTAKCGKIAIIKDAVPDDTQDFTFTTNIPGYPNNITLDDDATLPNPSPTPSIQTFSVPQTGNYSITENPEDSWDVAISCIDPSGGTTVNGNTANISMSSAEAIVCTFTNTQSVAFACTPNTWTQKADFGGGERDKAFAFSIGSKGYIGTGWMSSYLPGVGTQYYQDLWEYDPVTDTWTQKADFGGGQRENAVGFSIGDKGYAGSGSISTNGIVLFNDFWEYNPATNMWTQKANIGGPTRADAVGFSIGDKGYIGTGSTIGSYLQDFWEYNPATNMWTQKANFGGLPRFRATGFSIGGKGYIGPGMGLSGPPYGFSDFWEYNPATNAWTQKANFGGGIISDYVGFSLVNKGYFGTGDNAVNTGTYVASNDFWEYNPATNAWTQKASIPALQRHRASGFSINNKGYIGVGNHENTGGSEVSLLNDFWEYCP